MDEASELLDLLDQRGRQRQPLEPELAERAADLIRYLVNELEGGGHEF